MVEIEGNNFPKVSNWGRGLSWVLGQSTEIVVKGALKTQIEGESNLEKIDWRKPVMVVTTHLSDMDVPIVYNRLFSTRGWEMVIADQRIHHQPRDLNTRLTKGVINLIGNNRLFPIGWRWDRNNISRPEFEIRDYQGLKCEVFGYGRVLVMAGHMPTFDGQLPKKPGRAAAMVTQMVEGVQVVPIVVVMSGKPPDAYHFKETFKNREKQMPRMIVGEPFGVEKKLTDKDIEALQVGKNIGLWRKMREVLDEAGGVIMKRLAELMPVEKRGRWA